MNNTGQVKVGRSLSPTDNKWVKRLITWRPKEYKKVSPEKNMQENQINSAQNKKMWKQHVQKWMHTGW